MRDSSRWAFRPTGDGNWLQDRCERTYTMQENMGALTGILGGAEVRCHHPGSMACVPVSSSATWKSISGSAPASCEKKEPWSIRVNNVECPKRSDFGLIVGVAAMDSTNFANMHGVFHPEMRIVTSVDLNKVERQ